MCKRCVAATTDLCRKADLFIVCVRCFTLLLARKNVAQYIQQACKPHRGHIYTRKILCLCHIGCVDEAFQCASIGMDDFQVCLPDQLHLEQRSLSLWAKLGRKGYQHNIPETPPRVSKQTYLERYINLSKSELFTCSQSASSRLRFQPLGDCVAMLNTCALPMRKALLAIHGNELFASTGLSVEERVMCLYGSALGSGCTNSA